MKCSIVALIVVCCMLIGCSSNRSTVVSPSTSKKKSWTYDDKLLLWRDFHPERMGRVPDKFDFLCTASWALAYSERFPSKADADSARQKATEWHKIWQKLDEKEPDRSRMSFDVSHKDFSNEIRSFEEILKENPTHEYKGEIARAITQLRAAESPKERPVTTQE